MTDDGESTRRFWGVLLVIVFVALAIRVSYVAAVKSGPCPIEVNGEVVFTVPSDSAAGDELFYNATANRISVGDWFVEPFDTSAHPEPAADHPPLTALVLAPVSWFGSHPPLEWVSDDISHASQHRYAMALFGTLLVLLIGLVGREVAGNLTGWIAAALAAVAPTLWVNDGAIFSETITNVCGVAALLVALRLLRRPSLGGAAGLGALVALATLARAELALLAALLIVPVLVAAFGTRVADLWKPALATGAVALLLVGPWVGWNLSRFDEPVYLSSNIGLALAGSNCDPVYSGDAIGLTSLVPPCTLEQSPPGDQSVEAHALQTRALDYMRAHERRVPLVMAARISRTWSLYRPIDMVSFNEGEGRDRWVTGLGIGVFLPMLAVSVAGLLLQWRRRPIVAWVLVCTAVAVTIAVALTYGQTRFRAPAEPGIVVLAAVALAALVDRTRARRDVARDQK